MTDVRPLKRTADEVISPDVASRKKSARDGESFVCTICLESIAPPTDDNDERELIFCEGKCDSWLHRKCAGLPKPIFDSIRLSETPFHCPFCCLANYECLFNDMKATIASLEHKVSQLEKNSTPAINTFRSLSNTSNEPHDSTLVTPQTKETLPDNSIQDMVATLLNEEKEKEKRRLNIIVHNVPESSSEESLTRKNEDTEFVSKLCESQFNAKVSIVKAYRLGKKGAKPRLLKISLSSVSEKATVLKNCTQLRNRSTPPPYQNIFISPDLTPKE